MPFHRCISLLHVYVKYCVLFSICTHIAISRMNTFHANFYYYHFLHLDSNLCFSRFMQEFSLVFASPLYNICGESLQQDLPVFLTNTNYKSKKWRYHVHVYINVHLLFIIIYRHSLRAIRHMYTNIYARYYDYVVGTMCAP